MPIEFAMFPSSWRLPLWWGEVDPSLAGTGQQQLRGLLVGQMAAGASATPGIAVPCGAPDLAVGLFGAGSMLADMVNTFFQNNSAQELWCLPVSDPAGAKATGTIHVTNPPSQAGTISLYIAGQLIQINVGATDSASTVAANIVAAINADTDLPVTAALGGSGNTYADLTCKWIGTTGNDINIADSLLGTLGGQSLPTGLALAYSGTGFLAGGTGVPVFTTPIANLGDQPFEYVGLPYTDSTSMLAWQAEYGFTSAGRWGWMRQLYGQIYSARRDTYANLLVWGATQNAPQTSVMDVEPQMPSQCWEVTAAYCAEAAMGFSNDPARPLQTLQLLGIMPAPAQSRFTLTELNLLASTGLATQNVAPGGVVQILRETSTYQLNAYNSPDDAYTDMTTLATLATLLRNQKAAITTKFARFKLADDGTLFGPGQKVVTPAIIKAELVSEYAQDEFNGLVEDAQLFAKNLIVERDSNNPNRVNVLYPPNLIGQLRIFAVLAQFRLLGQQQTTIPQS